MIYMRTRPTGLSMPLLLLVALLIVPGCSQEDPLDPVSEASNDVAKATTQAYDPWENAELDQVTVGASLDMLSRRAVGVDNLGTVHAIYQRGVGAEQTLYYKAKSQGGEWSEPEVIGPAGTYPGQGWLEINGITGEVYVVFHEMYVLKLGVRGVAGWEFHTLVTPPEYGIAKPAMTVDTEGRAHIAMLASYDDQNSFNTFGIAYGYWDGTADFHFQLLDNSYVPHHGLFAQPDIVAWPGGRAALIHHGLFEGQYKIVVHENDSLGGTEWNIEMVDVDDGMPFPESLEIDQFGYLHLGFHTNIELGAEHHVYYCVRKDSDFSRPMDICKSIPGARPRLALTPAGEPHLVFEELLGPAATGRLIHAYAIKGKWYQNVIMDKDAFTPSFVMDDEGNGSLLFERRIIQMENNNIKYFGYTAP